MFMRVLVAAISLLLTLFSATSHAWWNEDWSARKKITLTNKAGEVADAPAFSGERVAVSFGNGGAKLNGSQSMTLPAINAAGGMSVARRHPSLLGILRQSWLSAIRPLV